MKTTAPVVFSLLAIFSFSSTVFADVLYPSDSGVINVKNFGAQGDGVTDDTAAIQAAIASIRPFSNSVQNITNVVYFPAGTYVVSDQLAWKDSSSTSYTCFIDFQGQSKTNTTIQLKNNASAFQSPSSPRAVLYTGDCSYSFAGDQTGVSGNTAFQNNINDLTVNTGSGNPGAIGISYLGNNITQMNNVNVVSNDGSGVIGLDLSRSLEGPLYASNMMVQGFDTGIKTGNGYAAWLEHITIANQNVVGISALPSPDITIRDLQSTNTVQALTSSTGTNSVTLIDANLSGGSSAVTAISNPSGGNMFLRNVTTSGYAAALSNGGVQVPGSSITEWTSKAPINLFSSGNTSLNLPVQETPVYNDTNFANWANVQSYGAAVNNPAVDSAAAIQAAIDSGKTTVYLPAGIYYISQTIHIRGNVVRVLGIGAAVVPFQNGGFSTGTPTFVFENTNSGQAILDGVILDSNKSFSPQQFFQNVTHSGIISNASSQTVVIKNIQSFYYTNSVSGGTVFIENVGLGALTFANQTVYIRHLDPEITGTHLAVNGGQVWVLGLKTEGAGTLISASNNAKVEVLGMSPYVSPQETTDPMILVDNSNVSVTGARTSGYDYSTWVQETQTGTTKYLYCSSTISGCPGTPKAYFRSASTSDLSLYVGQTPSPTPTVSLTANPTSIISGQSSTLTWSSTNATSCTGTGFTASGTSGNTSVSPTATTTYSITCNGVGGSASASTTVTVTSTTTSLQVEYDFTAGTGVPTTQLGATGNTISEDQPLPLWSLPVSHGYASDPELQLIPVSGATSVANAVADHSYFTITITPNSGTKMSLSSMTFNIARGGVSTPRGYSIRSSADSYASDIATADVTTIRPTWTSVNANLSGASYQNLTTPITFRFYVYAPDTGSSLEIDSIAFNGTSAVTTSDTTPPSTPTGLAGTAISTSQINLTWNASTDNIGVTGYKIFRNGTQVGTSATASYSDTGLTGSTVYSYTVSAYDAALNNSGQSGSVNVTTLAPAFAIGVRVKTTASLNVRSKPTTNASSKILCTQPSGALGTIIGGPTAANGSTWWNVNYDTSCDGWSIQDYLTTSIAMTPNTRTFASTQTMRSTSISTRINQLIQQIIALTLKIQALAAQTAAAAGAVGR